MRKACLKCSQSKPLSRYNIDPHDPDKHRGVCKKCQNAQRRTPERRVKRAIAQRRRRQGPQGKARMALSSAIYRGKILRPDQCDRCENSGFVEGHHNDYTKPLDVEWICNPCHRQEHVPGP